MVKTEIYYKSLGYEVVWNSDMDIPSAEKTFVSCIFTKNRRKAENYKLYDAEIGGTGVDLAVELSKEIYDIKPKINYDFATRGCIRNCKFCFVPKKEGGIRAERDLYDIWDRENRLVTFLDNNILALPEHFKLICSQAQRENLIIDFNQGLDIRLVNDEIARVLSETNIFHIRFALDHVNLIGKFDEKLTILRKYMPKTAFFVYVYVCKDYSWEDTMQRLEYLKEKGCRPYLMRDENVNKDKSYIKLARWVNQQHLFVGKTWQQFLEYEKTYGKVTQIETLF